MYRTFCCPVPCVIPHRSNFLKVANFAYLVFSRLLNPHAHRIFTTLAQLRYSNKPSQPRFSQHVRTVWRFCEIREFLWTWAFSRLCGHGDRATLRYSDTANMANTVKSRYLISKPSTKPGSDQTRASDTRVGSKTARGCDLQHAQGRGEKNPTSADLACRRESAECQVQVYAVALPRPSNQPNPINGNQCIYCASRFKAPDCYVR